MTARQTQLATLVRVLRVISLIAMIPVAIGLFTHHLAWWFDWSLGTGLVAVLISTIIEFRLDAVRREATKVNADDQL
jgi:hypothetical protein